MSNKAPVGMRSRTYCDSILPKHQQLFNEIVGNLDSSRTQKVFPLQITRWRQGEFELMEALGVPLDQVLHGEQSYTWDLELGIDQKIHYQTELTHSFEKSGGKTPLWFIVFETDYYLEKPDGKRGSRVAHARSTMIVRRRGV